MYACICMLKHSKNKKIEPPLDPMLRLDSDSDLRNGWYHTGLSISLRNTLLYGVGVACGSPTGRAKWPCWEVCCGFFPIVARKS